MEAGGRGRGGSIGELRACDSGGAGSGCETADALATAGDAEDDATSQLTQAMRQQTADGAEPEPMAAAEAEQDELLSLRRELFAQLGEEVGEAACSAAAAAAAPSELREPSKRARTAVQH